MISRRQIIESQQEVRRVPASPSSPTPNKSLKDLKQQHYVEQGARNSARATPRSQEASGRQNQKLQRVQRFAGMAGRAAGEYQAKGVEAFAREESREPDEGLDSGEEEESAASFAGRKCERERGGRRQAQQVDSHRHFDPYSIYGEEDEEEDVWYSEERLFEDHIQEIVDKWLAIDDEIWAKIICMERNRRIAKAYARKHSLTVNGSADEYLDGTSLGLNSFENPERDLKTRHIKQYIGQGLMIMITHSGDILAKRMSKASIFVHKACGTERQNRRLRPGSGSGRLGASNSSSDLYALNSDSGGDLYGDSGGFASTNSFSNYQLASGKLGRSLAGKSLINSDASTSSSSGNGKSIAASSKPASLFKSTSTSSIMNARRTGSASQAQPELEYTSLPLEFGKAVKIFDMSKFKSGLEREMRSACPDRHRLQNECISIVSFVVGDNKILNLPSWIMVINIVAIDLLRTELGLLAPEENLTLDYSIPPLPAGLGNANQRSRPDSYARPQLSCSGARDRHLLSSSDSIVSNSHPMMMMQRKEPISANLSVCAAASKKAFANAAALGAYEFQEAQQDLAKSRSSELHRKRAGRRDESASGESQSELEAKRNKLITSAGGKLLKQVAAPGSKMQTSASSSGFNSNCSNSQNDSSSPASSNSNLAAEMDEVLEPASSKAAVVDRKQATSSSRSLQMSPEPKSQNITRRAARNEKPPLESSFMKSCFNLSAQPDAPFVHKSAGKSARASRPPKLPHRMSGSQDSLMQQQQIVSEPMAIPAPPASHGKANLILVSPTGLSPPLPKRNVTSKQRKLIEPVPLEPTKFDSIKHIDQSGNCCVLLDNTAEPKRLPAGIPSHAKLAPPATQRHILRFLMSATRNKFAALNLDIEQERAESANRRRLEPGLGSRAPRPLPFLPTGRPSYLNSREENLYYCGLQARATNRTGPFRAEARPTLPPPPPKQSGGQDRTIEAMLANYKQAQHNQLLLGARQEHKRFPLHTTDIQQPSVSVTKPFLKFLKTSSTDRSKPIFSSLDNLTAKPEKSSGILGLKILKRSSKRPKEISNIG